MSKEEFLLGLEQALSGNVQPSVIQENLRYYNDYISSQVQTGHTQAEVLEELGDPRLIARTIIDTTPGAGDGVFEEVPEDRYAGAGQSSSAYNRKAGGNVHYYDLSKWYWKVLAMVMVFVVIMVVITVITGLLSLVIPILPIIGLVIVIMWFVQGPRR